jgi:uncharacterized protein
MDENLENKLRGFLSRIVQTTEELSEAKIRSDTDKSLLPERSYFIVADRYLDLFLQKKLNQRVLLIPGLRGIGKTTLLFQIYRKLLTQKLLKKEHLIYVDTGELVNNVGGKLDDFFKIYEKTYLQEHLEQSKENIVLFIDEAHYDKDWPSVAKSLFDRSDGEKNVLIIVSGSSALALSTNTDLSRRAISDHLYPLSFQEYLLLKYHYFPPKGTARKIRIALGSDLKTAHYIFTTTFDSLQKSLAKSGINVEQALLEYLALGASPMAVLGGPTDLYFRWWNEVLQKIVQQDLPSFSELSQKSAPVVFALLQFLAESPPSVHSLQSIAEKLNGVSKTSVFNILEALKNACILIEFDKDIDPLKKTNVAHKYYFMHPTIRAALLWSLGKLKKDLPQNDPAALGILFEDIIAFTLFKNKQRNASILNVAFGDLDGGADFIIKTNEGKIALECCWGRKGASQVRKSIEREGCKYGISAFNTAAVSLHENLIAIPRELLLFI